MQKRKYLLMGGIFFVSILILNLTVPYGGYTLLGGDSMYPTIDKGCGIVATESWDGESSLDGKIVAFKIYYETPSSDTYVPGTDKQMITWFVHTVIDEEKEYYMNESNYQIKSPAESHYVLEYKNKNGEVDRVATDQTITDVKELEGEHTFIAKGDNKGEVDAEIIPSDNVLGIIDEDRYIKLQSLDQWPCSIVS